MVLFFFLNLKNSLLGPLTVIIMIFKDVFKKKHNAGVTSSYVRKEEENDD